MKLKISIEADDPQLLSVLAHIAEQFNILVANQAKEVQDLANKINLSTATLEAAVDTNQPKKEN